MILLNWLKKMNFNLKNENTPKIEFSFIINLKKKYPYIKEVISCRLSFEQIFLDLISNLGEKKICIYEIETKKYKIFNEFGEIEHVGFICEK